MQALDLFRVLTCNAVPPPRWLRSLAELTNNGRSAAPSEWEQMVATLRKLGQDHVLSPECPLERREAFLGQLRSIDLERLPQLLAASLSSSQSADAQRLEPFHDVATLDEMDTSEVRSLRGRGLDMIARGEVAALLLAGGQGTRLGTTLPKGMYDIGLPSGKTLFQYHAERLRKVKQLAAAHAGIPEAQVRLPLVVMTSDATRDETEAYWKEHRYFGLAPAQLTFFEQGMNPCLTKEGKLMLAAPGELAMAPNGNGGCYAGMMQAGILDQLARDGVRGIFQFGVDNLLCHVADPTFVGFCAMREADCASKTVPKLHAHEPVGVVAMADGAPKVVEYSEISRELAEACNKDGRLLYGSAHICVNYFALSFLRRFIANDLSTMPLHIASKKIPTITPEGTPVAPTANNGIKLELFIFDNFPKAQRMQVLQVKRADEFAPIKNAPGAASDSPDTARELLYALNRRMLLQAGAQLRDAPAGTTGDVAAIEISPLLSYQGEGLRKRVNGQTLQLPLLLE
mmetsp:Transcript_32026/g.79758  ORF Transcript_32026/g.79758 Transcript_32026/m.79758 type:complete len:514 (+) Transcript_32026:23-1564(+)